ncbi:MAG: hypothetical protein ACKOJE_02225 [Bacteroidota bacterium]
MTIGFMSLVCIQAQAQRNFQPKARPFMAQQDPADAPISPVRPGEFFQTESTSALWTFNFSNLAGMTIQNDTNGGARWKVVSALEPNLSNFGTTLNSFSGAPFALINSDSFDTDTQDDYLTLKVGTSLVGQSGVQLSFRQYFRRYLEDHIVEVSYDSTNWTEVYNSSNVIPTNTTIANTSLVRINISPIAANRPNVWVRFNYVGAWDWFWAIDDIEVSTLPPNDLVLEDYDIIPKIGLCYNAQMALPHLQDSLIFSAAIQNFGQNTQPNSRLNARVIGASPLYNQSSTGQSLPSNARDTVEVRPYFNLAGRPAGTYTLRMEVLSDSADGSPANNVDTTMLLITENRVSPYYPASTNLGSLGTSSFTNNADGIVLSSLFQLTSQDTVTHIRVYLRSNTVAGGFIAVSVRDTDGIASTPAVEFPIIVESDLYQVTATDISRGYVDVFIPAVLAGSPQDRVLPAGPYYASAQLFSSQGASHIRVLDDYSNEAFMPGYGSLVYLTSTSQWYSNGIALGLAAIFGNPSATSVQSLEASTAKVYPNPFVNEVHWSLDLKQSAEVFARCFDLQGRLLAEGPKVHAEQGIFNHSATFGELPMAVYRVELWSEQGPIASRLMVKAK